MKRKLTSAAVSLALAASAFSGLAITADAAEAKTPQYQTQARQMEKLNRGLIAVKTTADTRGQTVNGVFLSWRLLGDESLENQAFDIYRDGKLIHTTGAHDATNYVDTSGTATSEYQVVKKGESTADEPAVTPNPTNAYAKPSEVGTGASLKNSFSYIDIPISRPDPVNRMGDGSKSYYYTIDKDHEGGANDASVGDLDGDGDYELVLKWDPTDSKDSAGADFTGNVYIDAYEIDPNNDGYMWRIDLGKNVTAGAHYTQFMVYDFDGDGKSEIAMKTAPGTIDGTGKYVTEVGDTDAIRNTDNTKSYIGTSGTLKGKNPFTQFLTIFDGETGAALYTTEFIPYDAAEDKYWGDGKAKYNRSERYLAAVAYLDGVHPSIIMCRGYYHDAVIRAYNWDGTELTQLWEHVGKKSESATTMYAVGNHNLSIGDIDDDGKDEIVYGSAALDDDGKTVLGNTQLGHGDAMHMSDFNNDGIQEVFSVKEDQYKKYAEDLRQASTGKHFWSSGKIATSGDNGRGVMDNIDDDYAKDHSNALAIGWSSGLSNAHDLNGDDIGAKPSSAGKGSFDNSVVYWDGDLSRELLDANIIQKYYASTGTTKRFYGPSDGYTLVDASTNNYTKRNASLTADLWGDWREEIIMPINKDNPDEQAYLRIYTSTMTTDYRLTTLMHDSQYRLGIAWQNVAYNQPPHTSYYIGSAALATDANGNTLNYLAPATKYTNVTYDQPDSVAVTGMTLSDHALDIEKGQSASISAKITPEDATKKSCTWTSSNTSVATVRNGVVKAVGNGTATITATTKDGGYSDTCTVTVWSTPVSSITLSNSSLTVGTGVTKALAANVSPADATDTSVTWVSSNPAVASVDEEGSVTGIMQGTAVITATTNDGSGLSASCTVQVVPLTATDETGDNTFDVVSNTDTSNTTITSTATGVAINHNNSTAGADVSKSFTSYSEDQATLSFRLVTGGQKIDGSNWNWTGHEYSMGVQLLDTKGNNILELIQPYASKAGTLTSQVIGQDSAESFESGWTKEIDGLGNIQGSAKRWIVNAEFNYDTDSCKVTVSGCDSSWAETGRYSKTFDLNGASFKTLRLYTTLDKSGSTIKANPTMSNVKYERITATTGTTNVLYEKGTSANTAWASSDTSAWKQTGGTSLEYSADAAANGRIYYEPAKPGTSYSSTKSFSLSGNGTVTYNVDWYFGNAMNRPEVFDYIKFGSNLTFIWGQNYKLFVTTDSTASSTNCYENLQSASSPIFTGSNTTFVKNIKVTIDEATKTIKEVKFDGNTLSEYSNYALPEDADISSVTFGFFLGGGTETWTYPNGLDAITVSEFVEGAVTTPDPSTTAPAESSSPAASSAPTASASPAASSAPVTSASPAPTPNLTIDTPIVNTDNVVLTVTNNGSADQPARLIVASYDQNNVLTGVKFSTEASVPAGETVSLNASFTSAVYIEVMLWNNENAMASLMNMVKKDLTVTEASYDEPVQRSDNTSDVASEPESAENVAPKQDVTEQTAVEQAAEAVEEQAENAEAIQTIE